MKYLLTLISFQTMTFLIPRDTMREILKTKASKKMQKYHKSVPCNFCNVLF